MKLIGLRMFRRHLALVLIASIVSAVATTVMVASVAMAAQNGDGDHQHALAFALAFLLFLATSMTSLRLQASIDANFGYELRLRLIRRILATRFEQLVAGNRHDLYNVVTSDVAAITRGVGMLPYFAVNLAKIIACVAYMAYVAPQLFLSLIVPLALLVLIARTLTARAYRLGNDVRDGMDKMIDGFKGAIDGAKELATNAPLRRSYYDTMQQNAEQLRSSSLDMGRAWGWNRTLTSTLLFVILGWVAFFGSRTESLHVVALFVLLTTYCIGSFDTVLQGVQQLSAAKNSINKINSLSLTADTGSASALAPAIEPAEENWQSLHIQDLHYQYPEQGGSQGFAIGPISVSIDRGELVFISGGNGSGKSTFMSVLVGLLRPQKGMMRLDHGPVLGEALANFQTRIGVVHSDFYLFDQVLDGTGGVASAEDANHWLRLLQLDKVVSVERGLFSSTKLSRGQRKRLALVAALVADKEIYVLDEWAADQDPYFREIFYETILPLLRRKGKTVIAISHDDRYYHVADRILRVESGLIEEVLKA